MVKRKAVGTKRTGHEIVRRLQARLSVMDGNINIKHWGFSKGVREHEPRRTHVEGRAEKRQGLSES